jgi:hypothetical protein
MLALMALVAVLVVAAGSVAAQAAEPLQVEPPPTAPSTVPTPAPVVPKPCYVARYDMNGDGRVSDVDFNQWKRWFLGPECQQGAGVCPPKLDTNGDGKIDFSDLNIMLDHYKFCVSRPWPNDLPPR